MTDKEKTSFKDTLFYKWILNNQAVVSIIITLFVFLTIFVFMKIAFLFKPILTFLEIIMLSLVISTILYYLTKPLIDFIESRGVKRTLSILIVFAIIVLFLIWAISGVFPTIQNQLTTFVKNLPDYVEKVNTKTAAFLKDNGLVNYKSEVQSMINNISAKAISYAESFSKNAITWAGDFAGAIARVTIAIIISPFILFYFLRDSGRMKDGLVAVLPTKWRQPIARVLGDINKQLSGYVQGQVTVAVLVGIMFSIMFSIVGLRYAVTFGVIAGVLNMVPYLGSFLAMVPVVIMGIVQGPLMLVKVLLIFMIEQTIEGRFVTPLVLGNKLKIHPITIMFLLLVAGSMFGVWGVFLAIPIYASIKVIAKEVFDWYKKVSGLYPEEKIIIVKKKEKKKEVKLDVK